MGSIVRHLIGAGRSGGKAAVIAGAAAALLSTGTAMTANMTPTEMPAGPACHDTAESCEISYKPRTGSGRDPVRHSPRLGPIAGLVIPARPAMGQLAFS
jgi:hypothetical protein